jgi:hypothetical protein
MKQLIQANTPHQNNLAKKKNIILLERTNNMTLACESLAYLWIEAINIATNLSNKCPTRTNNGISPKNKY